MTDQPFPNDVDADFARIDAADAHSVARLRHELSQWLRSHVTLDADKLNDILLAVNEALTNAAEFAYRGKRGTMGLNVHCDETDRALVVDVFDHGSWRHVDSAAQPNTRGRGIPLMRALADDTTISPSPNGTHVQMRFGDCALARSKAFASV